MASNASKATSQTMGNPATVRALQGSAPSSFHCITQLEIQLAKAENTINLLRNNTNKPSTCFATTPTNPLLHHNTQPSNSRFTTCKWSYRNALRVVRAASDASEGGKTFVHAEANVYTAVSVVMLKSVLLRRKVQPCEQRPGGFELCSLAATMEKQKF